MREIIITSRQAGQRFDRFLGKYMVNTTQGFLHKMLRKKNIKLNGGKATGAEKIKEGDCIEIYFSEETMEKFCGKMKEEPKKKSLNREQENLRKQVRALKENQDVILLHKPAGMLTQKAEKEDDSLNDYLIDYCLEHKILNEQELRTFHPSVANRLDRNTSGIVLCGISLKGLQILSSMLKERTLSKYYICLVKGHMEGRQRIEGYLYKNEKNNVVTLSSESTKGASFIETEYEVLQSTKESALVRIKLITGKSHQIRAHLASIGHPVFGDYKYGDREFNNRIKRESGINYQMLHSYEISIPQELKSKYAMLEELDIIDPIPSAFSDVQRAWGLDTTQLLYAEKIQMKNDD